MIIKHPRTPRVLMLAAIVLAAASCAKEPVDTLTPTVLPSSGTKPISSPSIFSPPPRGDQSPSPRMTAPPTKAPGSMQGEGSTTITGAGGLDIDLSFDRMDPYSYYGGPAGESGITFLGGIDTLTLGGALREGRQKTSSRVSLSLYVPAAEDHEAISLVSGNGSCVIDLTDATARSFAGTFRCPRAEVAGGTFVAVSGTFNGSLAANDTRGA